MFSTKLRPAAWGAKRWMLVAPWRLAALVRNIHLHIQAEGMLQCAVQYLHHVHVVLIQLPASRNMLGVSTAAWVALRIFAWAKCAYTLLSRFIQSARTPELLCLQLEGVRCTGWRERGAPCPRPCAVRRQAQHARPQSCTLLASDSPRPRTISCSAPAAHTLPCLADCLLNC